MVRGIKTVMTVTSPDGNHTVQVEPTEISLSWTAQESQTLSAVFEYGFDWYEDDIDPTNPLQTNSYTTIVRGTQTLFSGSLFTRELLESGEGGIKTISITATDYINKLTKVRASINGNPFFTAETPPVSIPAVPLVQGSPIGSIEYPFYPIPSDGDPWIPSANSNQTSVYTDGVGTPLSDFSVIIIAQADPEGFVPSGLLRIDSEWIEYDGYDFTSGSTRYRFKNCVRGALGTSAAAHAEGSTIYQRQSQKIHPRDPLIMEGFNTELDTPAWEYIDPAYYVAQPEEGRFDFTYDILTFTTAETNYNSLRISYSVFDEDNVDVVSLRSLLIDVLQESVINGGPGRTSGQISVGASLDDIKLTRIRLTKAKSCLDFIQNILEEVGLLQDNDKDAILLYHNPEDDKIYIQDMEQEPIPSYNYYDSVKIARDNSLENVHSAINVTYKVAYSLNLISHARCWHPNIGDTVGTGSAVVQKFLYQDEEDILLTGWDNDGESSSNNIYTERIVDSNAGTGWGLETSPDAVGINFDMIYFWFDNAENDFVLDEVDVIIDARLRTGDVDGKVPFHFQILAIIDPGGSWKTDPTTIAEQYKKVISGGLDIRFAADPMASRSTGQFSKVKLGAKDIGFICQGILCRWRGMAVRGDGKSRVALLKHLYARGFKTESVLVQLTDNEALDSTYIYAPVSYTKLIDTSVGIPRVDVELELGVMSRNAAISLGRLALLQALVYKQSREYIIVSDASLRDGAIPLVGETAIMHDDGYKGIILERHFDVAPGGGEQLRLRMIDLTEIVV